ncbi:MAG: primosomal protein N' [Rikenellaceae bacterium]
MYIEVLLPLYLDKLLTYSVPEQWCSRIVVGGRVAVNIGSKRVFAAIVIRISSEREFQYETKDISEIIDTKPIITTQQIELWQWIADYYVCTLGEVMKYFLPPSLRINGKIEDGKLNYDKSKSIIRRKELFLINKEAASSKAKKQQEALEHIKNCDGKIWRKDFPFSQAIIKALISNGAIGEHEVSRFEDHEAQESKDIVTSLKELTATQQKASDEITTKRKEGKPILLYGVSGSGKTEIYLHQIAQNIEKRKTTLVLLPELAITTQISERIKECFEDRVLTYNALESSSKRHDTYNKILTQKAVVVIGTRNAISLPFKDLGLIIVDEEHEGNYKQNDKRPYFNARDTAVMMGTIYGCDVLLVSATPSIESYYNCEAGKYNLVSLTERFGKTQPPKITIIDRRHIAAKDKQVYGYRYDTRYFSCFMLTKIKENIEAKGQTLILHNRRGFASYMECENCSWTPSCSKCNTTLTFHKSNITLACHYCGEKRDATKICPLCKGKMILHGIGAENVEEKIGKFFPSATIARLDGESMRDYKEFKNTIRAIAKGEKNIVVGTHIMAKGFNFPHATLTCVVNIDTSLNYPDFRSTERTFQLLSQFAGRTSRNNRDSEMIIQTSHPENELFTFIKNADYISMYNQEIKTRKEFTYPPFSRIIKIVLRHENNDLLHEATEKIALLLKDKLPYCIQNMEVPLIDKIRNLYILNITIRIPRGNNTADIKETIANITSHINKDNYKDKIAIDINTDWC